jgi:Protein of unknown function (DUF3631)
VAASKDAEPSLGIKLLADLRQVFGAHDELPSKQIIRMLCEIEEAPWGDLRGKPIDERGLAHRLRQYGVRSKTIRIGPATPKGYARADLVEHWSRYLPLPPATGATSETPQHDPAEPPKVERIIPREPIDEFEAAEREGRFRLET